MGLIADTIGDALNRIRNASNQKHSYVLVKKSKFLARILDILVQNGYIESYEESEDNKYFLKVNLKYYEGKPVIREIKVLSHLSRRIYIGYRDISPFKNNLGIVIISTPKGVMTTTEAKKLKIGGMLVCSVW